MNNMNNMMGGMSGMGGMGGGMNNMGMNSMNNMGGMGGGMGGNMGGNMGGMGGGMGGNMGGMGGSMGNMGMGGGMGNMNSMANMSGMGNMGGMGGNMNMNAMNMGNMGGAMRSQQGGVNPTQLGMAGMGGMSPAQMMQQQQQRMAMAAQGGMGGGGMGPMSPISNSMNPMTMGQGNMGGMGSMGQNNMQMNQGNYPGSGPPSMTSPTGEAVPRPGTSMSMHSNSGGGGGGGGGYPGQGGMGGGGSMNMGGMGGGMGGMQGGMNASSPPSQGHQQSPHPQTPQQHGQHGQPHGQGSSGPQSNHAGGIPAPNAQTQAMVLSAVATMGYSNEQFRGLPANEKSMVLNKAWAMVQDRIRNLQSGGGGGGGPGMGNQGQGGGPMGPMGGMQGGMGMGGGPNQGQMSNQNQGHQQQPPGPPHERPPSSASTHSQHEMMMPPPPRPSTSMSMSRPGTAMGMGPPPSSRPGTSQGGQPGMGGHGRSISGSGGPPSTGRGSVPPGSPSLGGMENAYPQAPPTPSANQGQPPSTPKMGGSAASSPTRPNTNMSSHPQTPMQQNNSMPQIPVNGMVTAGMTPQGMAQNMMGRSGSASSLMGANPMVGMGGMNAQGPMNAQSPMSQGHPGMQRHGSMPPPHTPQTPTHPQTPQIPTQIPQRNQTPHPPNQNQRQSSLPPPGNTNKMGGMTPGRMSLPMPGSNMAGSLGNMSNSSMENLNSGDQNQGQTQPNGQVAPVVKQGSVPPPSTPSMPQQSSSPAPNANATSQAPNNAGATQPTAQNSTQTGQQQQQQQQTSSGGTNANANPNVPVQTRLQPPPPLPSSVSLNPAITRVTPVALVGSDKTIPQLTPEEIEQIKGWMKSDEAYEGFVIREGADGTKEKELGILRKQRDRMAKESREAFGGVAPGGPSPSTVDGLDRAALNAGAWWERGGAVHGKWFNPTWEWWEGRLGGGGRPVEKRFDVRYPGQWAHQVKKRDAQSGVNQGHSRGRYGRDAGGKDNKAVRREGLKVPRKLTQEDIDMPEELVPIRLEFDVDHHKMRDTFVWNLNDPVVTPESFAQTLVEDYALPNSYHSQIVKQIQDQLTDFKSHSAKYSEDGDLLPVPEYEQALAVCKGVIGKDESKWWERWRKRLRGAESNAGRKRRKLSGAIEDDANDGDDENDDKDMVNGVLEDEPMDVDQVKVDEGKMRDDLRIVIKIDIIVGSVKLDDQFEWDIDNGSASPELFAETYAQDLGLSGEFKTAIAHSIREQVQTYQKSLYLVGRPTDGSPIQDEDLRQSFLPTLSDVARSFEQVGSFTPRLDYLSENDLERNEKERDKEYKRRKRNTRGRRGVNLPDREPIRTCRTPAIGFNDTGEAEGANASNSTGIMPSTTRRAAAAAASLTIANMVASENGSSPIMGQATLPGQIMSTVSTPQPQAPPPPPPPKKTIPKGLFKAPPVPSEVLRPRSKIAAPTPSTGVDSSRLPGGPPDSTISAAGGAGTSRNRPAASAKRVKELEREAKEREFADGQHPNFIDGVWHCSNCGCPESIAVGRRKGPLGDKSQCGTCGKYWHRHRRPRPVEYNTDPEYHSNMSQRDGEVLPRSVLTVGRRGRGRGGGASAVATPEPSTPLSRRRELASDRETPSRRHSPPPSRRHSPPRAVSPPLSSASSASESPLALKVNGSARGGRSPRPPLPNSNSGNSPMPPPASDGPSQPPPSSSSKEETKEEEYEGAPLSSASAKTWPPGWLTSAMQATQSKYPNDKFEIALRKMSPGSEAEWRIKCIDCPGKLYKPGPGETLSNFEVHLKNRQHRQRVDERSNPE
ncbi:SWI/SNF chromatin-remodeling complex subunit [Marasmius crinis-equi]|uniref:SWI/SNF chromatin-remodeling complex subunit n=1 Tax=Marasmius crinis-equi TaxID=585013 RepID=A0ABR3FT44_9AGAR